MPRDNRLVFPEQLCHLALREPDGLAIDRNRQRHRAVFRLKQDNLVRLLNGFDLALRLRRFHILLDRSLYLAHRFQCLV